MTLQIDEEAGEETPRTFGPDYRDIVAGVIVVAVAILFAYKAMDYGLGTARNMGAGYFPFVLSIIGGLLGVVVIAKAVLKPSPTDEQLDLRRLLLVSGAFLTFALTIDWAGLFATIVATTIVGSLAHRDSTIRESLIFGVVLAAGVCLLFVQLLGLAINVWPEFS